MARRCPVSALWLELGWRGALPPALASERAVRIPELRTLRWATGFALAFGLSKVFDAVLLSCPSGLQSEPSGYSLTGGKLRWSLAYSKVCGVYLGQSAWPRRCFDLVSHLISSIFFFFVNNTNRTT